MTVAVAAAGEVPLILRGVGTVQAFNTAAVRSKVDGYTTRIAYREGQAVKAGDLLVRIDPRPYEAVVQQANTQLARNEAALANAQLDLSRYEPLVRPGFTPRQTYETQRSLVAQTQAAIQVDKGPSRPRR